MREKSSPAAVAGLRCRGCGHVGLTRVVDLGLVPAADHFPPAGEPVHPTERSHGLAMVLCEQCGLAQLGKDDTVSEEPRGVEPRALREQAEDAVERAAAAGLLRGRLVREFGSPHGGTWLPLLTRRGFADTAGAADVVVDSFGIMHEPDQRQAFERRAVALKPGGVLLMQFHSLSAIVRHGQWNALRHGHFAYYSLTSAVRLLNSVGLQAVTAWEFDLYGGTVMVAAAEGAPGPDDAVRRLLDAEEALGVTTVCGLARLQRCADEHARSLRRWLEREADAGRRVLAYGAASRAVALLSRAGIDSRLLAAVADASPAKLGRRMPGTDIPIVSPDELARARPDRVLLTLPDLLPEVRSRFPQFDGRWKVESR